MEVQQFVMAYGVEQDRLRAALPEGFTSLRPVLRINAEIRNEKEGNEPEGYIEFNTAVEKDGFKGWLNIGSWADVSVCKDGKKIIFQTDFLRISFVPVGVEGSCPAEKDNDGCFFLNKEEPLRAPEIISANKEFCDCRFKWSYTDSDAFGESIGKTLPAIPEEQKKNYPKEAFTPENLAHIPCNCVLGCYTVKFQRSNNK